MAQGVDYGIRLISHTACASRPSRGLQQTRTVVLDSMTAEAAREQRKASAAECNKYKPWSSRRKQDTMKSGFFLQAMSASKSQGNEGKGELGFVFAIQCAVAIMFKRLVGGAWWSLAV
jgi:hypothetical protein